MPGDKDSLHFTTSGSIYNSMNYGSIAGSVQGKYNYAPEQKQNLAEAAAEIQVLLTEFQNQGFTLEDAQQKIAQALATKADQDPTVLGKVVKWGQLLGNTGAKTTVTEGAKEVIVLTLRLLGIPIP